MPGPARDDDLIHLICFDFDSVHGWEFRVPAWFPRTLPTQFFSRAQYGTMEAAYLAAKAARDRLFADEDLPLQLGWRPCNARNSSGLTGVRLAFAGAKRNSRASGVVWSGEWTVDGRQVRKRFSVRVHGFEGALELAVQFRMLKTQVAPSLEEMEALRASGLKLLRERLTPAEVASLVGGGH